MFPDAGLIRDLQKELDAIIQEGVHNITKLIKLSESRKLLNLQTASVENQPLSVGTLRSQARRPRGPKVGGRRAAESASPEAPDKSLASRLVQQGLLTADMLRQLEREWQTQQTSHQEKDRAGTEACPKGTRRKKKDPNSE